MKLGTLIPYVSLYLLTFLIPLWMLPFTSDALAFQKQALLVVLVFVSLVFWFGGMVKRGEFTIQHNPLYYPVSLLLLGVGVSTVFSLWPYASFWGFPLDISDSFLTIAAFAIYFFLTVNLVQKPRQMAAFAFALVVSVLLAGIFAVFQAYGNFILDFHPIFEFTKQRAFNTVGSLNSLGLLGATLLPLALALAFVVPSFLRWFVWLAVVVLLGVVAAVNLTAAWIALIGGLIVLVALGTWRMRKGQSFGWISFPMALLVIALFFLLVRFSVPWAPPAQLEVSPSIRAQVDIAKQVLVERPVAFLFGSGPGTFVFDHARFHSSVLNQSIFWGTRFNSGASEFLDWIMTKGVVAFLALGAIIAVAAFSGVKRIVQFSRNVGSEEALRNTEDTFLMMGLGTLASLTAATIGLALHASNFSHWFLFWTLLGLLGVFAGKKSYTIPLASRPLLAMGFSFFFLVVVIFGSGLVFLGGQKYGADVFYLKGIRAFQTGNVDEAIAHVVRAAQFNSSVDVYWRDLARLYLAKANQITADQTLSDETRTQQLQAAVFQMIQAAKNATDIAPANVANWNVRGFVYRNLLGIADADTFAIESYQKAIELEPASPFTWTELGRVHILRAQRFAAQETERQQAFSKALEHLQKAIELKSDYAPAHFLVAVVYDQQGKSKEAIAKLQEAKAAAPNDIGILFQLGTIYWRKGEHGKAQEELELARDLNPNYSNARYMLGLVYDKQNQRKKAVEEFLAVERLNPTNSEVKAILANLRSGAPALQGIVLREPPIQENPPEITGEGKEE